MALRGPDGDVEILWEAEAQASKKALWNGRFFAMQSTLPRECSTTELRQRSAEILAKAIDLQRPPFGTSGNNRQVSAWSGTCRRGNNGEFVLLPFASARMTALYTAFTFCTGEEGQEQVWDPWHILDVINLSPETLEVALEA
jgi:hypothetical protein